MIVAVATNAPMLMPISLMIVMIAAAQTKPIIAERSTLASARRAGPGADRIGAGDDELAAQQALDDALDEQRDDRPP